MIRLRGAERETERREREKRKEGTDGLEEEVEEEG